MSTEARIGVVAGLLIVVVASVYFFYGNDAQDTDVLVSADPKLVQPPKIPASTDAKPQPTPTPAGKPLSAAPRPAAPVNSPLVTSGGVPPEAPRAKLPVAVTTPRSSSTPNRLAMSAGGGEGVATPEHPIAAPSGGPGAASGRPGTPGTTTQPTGVTYWPRRPTSAPAAGPSSGRRVSPRLRSEPSTALVDATRDNLAKGADASTDDADLADDVVSEDDTEDVAPTPSGSADPTTPAATRLPSDPPVAPGARPASTRTPVSPPSSIGAPVSRPSPGPSTSAPPAETWPKKHEIAQGDTLSSLADRYYGSSTPDKIAHLLKANPQLKNPRSMKIGDQLTILAWDKPAATPPSGTTAVPPRGGAPVPTTPPPTAPAAAAPGRTYQVSDGDSFYSIARAQLGNGARWQELLRLNEDLVKGDPKRLKPGMIIKLP